MNDSGNFTVPRSAPRAERTAPPRRWQLGREQREQMVADHLPLVKRIACGLARRSTDPVEDLVQVGSIGLLEAIERYETGHNTEFKTYAIHLITGHMRHYLRDKQNLLRGPRALQELSYRLSQITHKLAQQLDREPTNVEIAEYLGISTDSVDEVRVYDRRVSVLWLDQVTLSQDEDDTGTLMDSLTDPNTCTEGQDEQILLNEAISKLDPSDKEILELHYFLDLSQAELSRRLNLSQMKICRRLKRAEKKLRVMLLTDYPGQ